MADANPTARNTGSDPADTDRDPNRSSGAASTSDDHAPTSDTKPTGGDDEGERT